MLNQEKIADLRKEYSLKALDIVDILPNPIQMFQQWFQEAVDSQVLEPNAMFLATVAPSGQPSGRVVLLKGIENEKFIFYTNYQSKKGAEITQNPAVCLTFFWAELERQVRIEGHATQTDAQISDRYFHSRPKGSQLGAWVSPQSQVIENRHFLDTQLSIFNQKFENQAVIPRPEHWGGYEVSPHKIEFWQGRTSRLHDRLLYVLQEDNSWKIERLAP